MDPRTRYVPSVVVFVLITVVPCFSQIAAFPYVESFDSTTPPALPPGWSSTQNRTPGTNDFATSSATPRSLPNAVLSTNATISQSLFSPLMDFRGQLPGHLTFHTRRSATHLARVVVEGSVDSGLTFPIPVGDSLTNSGSTNYVLTSFPLPAALANRAGVRLRWRVVPDASGNTGTFRVDDIVVTVQVSHDLAVTALYCSPNAPIEQDSIQANVFVRNAGLQTAQSFLVNFYNDRNHDSIPQPNELVAVASNTLPLAAADSVGLFTFLGSFPAGERLIIAQVVYQPDQNPQNDRTRSVLRVGYRPYSVVVNEIMYSPVNNEPEWVELYNTRSDSINIRDWLISDNNIATRRVIAATAASVPPRAFAVLTKDSAALVDAHPGIPFRIFNIPSMPTLNNTGDAVVLYDNRALTMDSLTYAPGWGGSSGGKSLERIDPAGPSTAQSNWSSSRHSDRSTPGRKNSITRKDVDIAIDTLLLSALFPFHGDTVIVSARVRNAGFQPVNSFIVRLYDDVNADSIPQGQELVSTVVHSTVLPPLDSLLAPFPPFLLMRNEHLFIVAASLSSDEDTLNNTSLIRVLAGIPRNSVVINEVMYSPVSEPEWIELFNTTAESVDVRGWMLSNRNTASRYVIASTRTFLQPYGYAVISKDTALLVQRYARLSGLLLQVPSLPTFLFNNAGDAVVAFDSRELLMDSVRYAPAWGGNGGTSLERIDPYSGSPDSLNWFSSTDSLRGTPGRENSVATLDHDLQALKTLAVVAPPHVSATLPVTVKNIGRMASTGFDVTFFNDRNHDSVATSDESIVRLHIAQSLARRETVRVNAQWIDPPAGLHTVIARVEYDPDVRLSNNLTIFTVKVGYEQRAVIVNEIMYAPFTNEAEYVELLNVSAMDIDLLGWKLADRPGNSGTSNEFSLASHRRTVPPGGFFVIASDSSFFSRFRYLDSTQRGRVMVANQSSLSLNNDGDAVIIRDATLGTIDSVAYSPRWHNPAVTDATGRSLERITPGLASNDARAWSTCVFGVGGTPALANSVFAASLPTHASLSCSPNPFSPDGDGREDFSVIHYELPANVATASLRVYDVRGRLIRYLVNNEPGGPKRDVVWDGLDDERQRARVGVYIVLVEGVNESGGSVYSAKGVVVLAAKL